MSSHHNQPEEGAPNEILSNKKGHSSFDKAGFKKHAAWPGRSHARHGLPATVVNFTHAGPAVADLAPQSPPPAGSSTAPPPSPRVSLTNLHCNGDARPEPLAPLAAEVTPRQKRPSILDTPFQPIKPTVKPVDPSQRLAPVSGEGEAQGGGGSDLRPPPGSLLRMRSCQG